VKPSSKRPKISGGPKDSATFVSGGASSMMPSTLAVPAMNDPNAAMPSAGPARPCRAIWYPSRHVTTEAASPGRLTRMEVVDPPYIAP
jgi:hypothetical protein